MSRSKVGMKRVQINQKIERDSSRYRKVQKVVEDTNKHVKI